MIEKRDLDCPRPSSVLPESLKQKLSVRPAHALSLEERLAKAAHRREVHDCFRITIFIQADMDCVQCSSERMHRGMSLSQAARRRHLDKARRSAATPWNRPDHAAELWQRLQVRHIGRVRLRVFVLPLGYQHARLDKSVQPQSCIRHKRMHWSIKVRSSCNKSSWSCYTGASAGSGRSQTCCNCCSHRKSSCYVRCSQPCAIRTPARAQAGTRFLGNGARL